MSTDWECIVVGGGVAGLSTALVLGRARRRTLVLDCGRQSNRPAAHVGGLLAHEDAEPVELYARARDQLAGYESVVVRDAEAVDAHTNGDGFVVVLGEHEEVSTSAIVLATGMDYEVPHLPDFAAHWGRDVFHCPFCHGWEVRDRPLVVCGDGEVAERQAALLRAWSDQVMIVPPAAVAGLRTEDGGIRALVRRDGSEVACEAVLVHTPLRRRGRLPEALGLGLTDQGLIQIDGQGRASVPGVYAAGDVAVAPQQVAIAIGSGHLTGIAVVHDLVLGAP